MARHSRKRKMQAATALFVGTDNYRKTPREIRALGLSPALVCCMEQLYDCPIDADGWVEISQETLGQRLNRSVRSIQRYLDGLLARAVIGGVRRRGQGRCNKYRLLPIGELRGLAAKITAAAEQGVERIRRALHLPEPAPSVSADILIDRAADRPPRRVCPDCGGSYESVSLGTCQACDAALVPESTNEGARFVSALRDDAEEAFSTIPASALGRIRDFVQRNAGPGSWHRPRS